MIERYRSIILGASFYGCGLAATHPEALLIEPAILVGGDFALSYFPGTVSENTSLHPEAEAFRMELSERGALRDGRLHLAAISPLLSDWCLQRSLNLLLNTEILVHDAHSVQIMNIHGPQTLEAEQIIDARPQYKNGKYLGTVLSAADHPAPEGRFGDLELCSGALPGEAYARISLEENCSWPKARRRLYSAWENRPVELASVQFGICGNRFGSYQFANPLAALSAGLNRGWPKLF